MNWNEIKDNVESNGDVWTTTMATLRDAMGKGRLGRVVLKKISMELAGRGLGHIPVQLPSNQNESVRLYKRGTTVGDFVDIVLRPGPANDASIRDRLNDDAHDHAAVLEQIRDIVNDVE